ncbi:response regulator [Paraflavisolibacter sp. H34]|uniref:response regulator n=1 Tax=Huijunlia imazamoxiresistens TaxID=3127457 RepID=UPI003019AC0B
MEDKNKDRTILLVDDDADDRKYFLEALAEIDPTIRCRTARDGQQALELLQHPSESLPHYIFLDLRMPRVNGRQCLLQIKADERIKDIPVIIYTTSTEVEEAEDLQQLGAVHFISKPSDPDEIYYVLSLVLEERWNDKGWERYRP